MRNEELSQIINEYEQQNNIERITEEELLDFIPESALYPNLYLLTTCRGHDGIIYISDYELYMLNKGINIIEDPPFYIYEKFHYEICQTEDGMDLGDAEQLSEADQYMDLITDDYFPYWLYYDNLKIS